MKKYRFFVTIILCLVFFVSSKFSNIFASTSNDFNKDFYEYYKSLPKTNLEEYKICENLSDRERIKNKGTTFQTLDLENGFSVDSLYNFLSSYYSSDYATVDDSKLHCDLPSLDILKEKYNKIYISLYPVDYKGDGIDKIICQISFYDSNATFTNSDYQKMYNPETSGSNYRVRAKYYHYNFYFTYYLKNSFSLQNSKTFTNVNCDFTTNDSDFTGSIAHDSDAFGFNPEYVYKCNFDISSKDGSINFKADDFTVDTLGKKDAEIGDTSSRLKLSYEYNKEYTECKINATLEGGQFTDRIFYSNYMPSIAGQGLLSKKAFPRERYNCK